MLYELLIEARDVFALLAILAVFATITYPAIACMVRKAGLENNYK